MLRIYRNSVRGFQSTADMPLRASKELKSLWEMISIADKEKEENWKVKKSFQNNQTTEL